MKLGELLRLGREVHGWTVRDVERETGISNSLISQIETGHIKNPSFVTVVRICEVLNLPLDKVAQECASLKRLKEVLRKPPSKKP